MKIYDTAGKIKITKYPTPPQVQSGGNSRGPDGSDGPIKTSSFVMDKMKARIASETGVVADRVAKLKEQIKSGDYKVDAQKLARNMLVESLKEDLS